MKIAVVAGLTAIRDVDVNAGHEAKVVASALPSCHVSANPVE